MEWRDYPQTTRMGLLENLALEKRVILGIDTDIRAADYLRYKARHYGVKRIHKTLEGCLQELKEMVSKTYIVSFCHFFCVNACENSGSGEYISHKL